MWLHITEFQVRTSFPPEVRHKPSSAAICPTAVRQAPICRTIFTVARPRHHRGAPCVRLTNVGHHFPAVQAFSAELRGTPPASSKTKSIATIAPNDKIWPWRSALGAVSPANAISFRRVRPAFSYTHLRHISSLEDRKNLRRAATPHAPPWFLTEVIVMVAPTAPPPAETKISVNVAPVLTPDRPSF